MFRIVCERTIEHAYALEELDSSYDNCGTIFCDRPEANVKQGCPECLVTTLVQELKDDCETAFANFAETSGQKSDHVWLWTFPKLQQDVAVISGIDASVGSKGYDPNWTVRTKSLISILRDERYKAQRARLKEASINGRGRDTE